jgi:hypothetical protein
MDLHELIDNRMMFIGTKPVLDIRNRRDVPGNKLKRMMLAHPQTKNMIKKEPARRRNAATRAGEGSAKKLSQPWEKDADEPDYTWSPDYSFYNERFKHCLRHHFFVDP